MTAPKPSPRHAARLPRRRFLAGTGIALGLHCVQPLCAAERRDPDVVVLGGVPCGIAAAVAAAREGAKVVLLEPTRHVGGLNTSGLNTAETEHMLKWTFGGIALEFYRRMGEHYGTGRPEFYFESSVAERTFNDLLREAGVEVRFGVRVEQVARRGARSAASRSTTARRWLPRPSSMPVTRAI